MCEKKKPSGGNFLPLSTIIFFFPLEVWDFVLSNWRNCLGQNLLMEVVVSLLVMTLLLNLTTGGEFPMGEIWNVCWEHQVLFTWLSGLLSTQPVLDVEEAHEQAPGWAGMEGAPFFVVLWQGGWWASGWLVWKKGILRHGRRVCATCLSPEIEPLPVLLRFAWVALFLTAVYMVSEPGCGFFLDIWEL